MRALILVAGIAPLVACSSDTATSVSNRTAASLSVVSGNTQSGMVDSQLGQPLVVRVTDAHGAPVEGFVVNFVVTHGGGHVYGGAEVTNENGIAQELWTLGPTTLANPFVPDSQVLEARAVNDTTGAREMFARFSATALPGAPYYLMCQQGTNQGCGVYGTFGQQLTAPVAMLVEDSDDNPCTGDTLVYTVKPGSGTITGANAIVDAHGRATLGTWTLGSQYADTLIATVRGVAPDTIIALVTP